MSTEHDWHRLGDAVRRRRERLGLTQQEVAGRGGPSTATMRQIEGALADGYRAKTLYALDEALGWFRGTCLSIFEGEYPSMYFGSFEEWIERTIRDVSREVREGQDFPVGTPLSVVPDIVDLPADDEDNEVLAAIRRDPSLSPRNKAHFLNQYAILRDFSAVEAAASATPGERLPYVAHGQQTTPVDPDEEKRLEEIARAARPDHDDVAPE